MSLVYITHHNENIYDIEGEPKRPTGEERKSSKYLPPESKASNTQYGKWLQKKLNDEYKKHQIEDQENGEKLLTSSKKCRHRTMGCAKTLADPPCAFLRKNQGVKWRRENEHKCPPPITMPPIPRAADMAKPADNKPSADFVELNIEKVKQAAPKRSMPRYVDKVDGTRHNLINSGLIPQYMCRKDFGKIPNYLTQHKQMLSDVKERCESEQQKRINKDRGDMARTAVAMGVAPGASTADLILDGVPGVRQMPVDERQAILDGLKSHLSELTKTYQSMSLHMDTASKRLRKGKLEADLRQVEQDILLVETSPIIYVSDI